MTRMLLLALAAAALAAGAAQAQGRPPHPPGPPPNGPGPHQGPPPGPPQQRPGAPTGATGPTGPKGPAGPGDDAAFRNDVKALGLTCLRRPLLLRGTLGAVSTGSLTLHTRTRDVAVTLVAATAVHVLGQAKTATLAVGDLTTVLAVPCRSSNQTTTPAGSSSTPASAPTLVARMVLARPARS